MSRRHPSKYLRRAGLVAATAAVVVSGGLSIASGAAAPERDPGPEIGNLPTVAPDRNGSSDSGKTDPGHSGPGPTVQPTGGGKPTPPPPGDGGRTQPWVPHVLVPTISSAVPTTTTPRPRQRSVLPGIATDPGGSQVPDAPWSP